MSIDTEQIKAALSDRYVIEREAGSGGMATVYLAHDAKHDRQVALKVLRPELAAVIGADRFLNEIKVTANLQHPHILPLHDSGAAGSVLYYVMPYVDGESLRDKLDREKQLGIDEAIKITESVAAALDYAHRQQVIHRDIKPENILLHDGQALIADFGIALAVSHAGSNRLTETGLSIGTPQYMSPEQAMGDREIDARSDVYSLGAMLYEMLAGDPPYTGSTAQAIVAKVITDKAPPVTSHRDTVPSYVSAAIQKALNKLPADRFSTAAEFAHALSHPGAVPIAPTAASVPGVSQSGSDRRFVMAVAVAAVMGIAAVMGWFRSSGSVERAVIQFDLMVPEAAKISPGVRAHLTMSPSGDRLVFVGQTPEGDDEQLYVRELSEMTVAPLAGTDDAIAPTFSPDGTWIAYFSGTDLMKVPAVGGASITLTNTAGRGAQGGAWLDDGTLVFTDSAYGLSMVSEAGGVPEVVASSEGNGGYYWPHAVPGERAVLATMCRTDNCAEEVLLAVDLDTREVHELVEGAVNGWALPGGYLVFARPDGALFAVALNTKALSVEDSPIPLLEGVRVQNGVVGNVAFSRSGSLVYLTGDASVESQVVLVDRSGTERAVTKQLRDYVDPRFSPDGRQLVVEIHDEQVNGHLWIYDLASETLSRLTYEGHDGRAFWMPDGRTITFSSNMNGGWKGYTVPADGSAAPETSIDTEDYFVRSKTATPDSKTLIFHSEGADDVPFALYAVELGSDEAPKRIVESSALEWTPALSRDGRWLAYASDESGREEIYVRNFANPAGRHAVSVDGGSEPLWGENNELFFRGPEGMYAATLEFQPTFRVVRREPLFGDAAYAKRDRSRAYDLHPLSGEFLFVRVEESSSHPRVVVNFVEDLKAKMGN